MEYVASEAQKLLTSFQAASLEGLRTHAETAAREAAESAKILSQAKATAVQALRQDWLDKGVSSSHMLWQCMDIVHALQNQNGPLREGGAAKGAGSSGGGRETLSGGEALSQCKAVVRDYLLKHMDARATEHLLKSDQLLKLIVDIYVFGPATLSMRAHVLQRLARMVLVCFRLSAPLISTRSPSKWSPNSRQAPTSLRST